MDSRILLFESLTVFLFALCLRHAIKRNHDHLPRFWYAAELLGALFFGLLLEWVNLYYFSIYHYGNFLVSMKGVPVSIGLLWAIVLYSSLYTSDCWKLPCFYQICLDGLLVFFLDLSIDPIAIRLNMWHWDVFPLQDQWRAGWYGVPYGNFYGWIIVALSFSTIARLLRKLNISICFPILIAIPAEVILYAALKMPYCNNGYVLISILSCLMISVIIGIFQQRQKQIKPDSVMVLVPLCIQGFFMGCLFTPMIDNRADFLLLVGTVIILYSLSGYLLIKNTR